jgi:hypothetical protein
MRQYVSAKPIVLVMLSIAIASVTALLALVVPEASATTETNGSFYRTTGKADRLLDPPKGATCSLQGWPHYERHCLFDRRTPTMEAKPIRIIALR